MHMMHFFMNMKKADGITFVLVTTTWTSQNRRSGTSGHRTVPS
jgi:hypothetical protein